jgi:outer membrane protein assembly factor BamA
MRFKFTAILLFILYPLMPVQGEESVTIGKIITEIDGKTNRNAILKELRIYEGKEFSSLESLENLVNSRANDLIQRRIFKNFEWHIDSADPQDIEIHISLKDSFTLMPRPMFKYSTDKGITLGLKLQYYNAFGTLTDQMFQAYWSPSELLFEINVEKLILGPFHLDTSFKQFDGLTRYGSPDGTMLLEYRNSYSELTVSLDMPLGPGSPWIYQFTPIISWQYNYRYDVDVLPELENRTRNEGFTPGLNHGIVTDQVEWIGNFRKGFYFEFMNNNLWYTATGHNDMYLESDLKAYLPLTSWLEISGRVGGFYSFDNPRKNAGDRLRGVVDYMAWGDWGNFLSFQMDFKVIDTSLFSLHLRPFTDIGYVYSDIWGNSPEAWEYCGGATAIIYIPAIPSLTFNIDWGWDFKRNMPELIIDTVNFL